jgi:hypothetical protein
MEYAKARRILSAFLLVVTMETYAVNHSSSKLDQELQRGFEIADHTITWEAVTSILSHSANLSKVFWPPSKDADMQLRAAMMRKMMDTTDESPLRSRTVRNGFEHLDERLHEWLMEDRPALIDQFIGGTGEIDKYSDRFVVRTFDYETGIVTVGDEAVGLRPLIAESDRLYEKHKTNGS